MRVLTKDEVNFSQWRRVYRVRAFNPNRWNEEVIKEVFNKRSANAILQLEWPPIQCLDKTLMDWK